MGEWLGGKIIPRIRLTSAKVVFEVEAELGKNEKILQRKHSLITFIYSVH